MQLAVQERRSERKWLTSSSKFSRKHNGSVIEAEASASTSATATGVDRDAIRHNSAASSGVGSIGSSSIYADSLYLRI